MKPAPPVTSVYLPVLIWKEFRICGLQEFFKLFGRESGVFGDVAHGDRVDWVVARNC